VWRTLPHTRPPPSFPPDTHAQIPLPHTAPHNIKEIQSYETTHNICLDIDVKKGGAVSTKTGCCFFLQGGKQNAKKHEKQHLKNVEKHGTGVKQQGHNRKKGIVIKGWNEELSLHAVLSFLLNNKKEKYVIPFCFVLFLFLGNGETILNKKKERALAKSVKHQKTKPKKNKLKEKKEIYSRLPVVLSLQMNSSALFFISLPLSIPSSIHFALLFFRHSHTNTHTHISVSSTRHESSQTNTTRLQQIWLFFFFLVFPTLFFFSVWFADNEWMVDRFILSHGNNEPPRKKKPIRFTNGNPPQRKRSKKVKKSQAVQP
jgi:hypothetical protein